VQLFDSNSFQSQDGDNFHVHTRLNLIGFLTQEDQWEEPLQSAENQEPDYHPSLTGISEARRGFLSHILECSSCHQAYYWMRDKQIYHANHTEDCSNQEPLQGFQIESMVGSTLRRVITPANVSAILRYQEQIRDRRQSEALRLRIEINQLRQKTQVQGQFQDGLQAIETHRSQLRSALDRTTSRRIHYLENALARWESGPELLNDGDALAFCLLARDFNQIWSNGTRAVRRRILHETASKIHVYYRDAHPELEFRWKVTGMEQRATRHCQVSY